MSSETIMSVEDQRIAQAKLADTERAHITLSLRYFRGNRRLVAASLGIARSTLLAKLRKYGLDGK